jgi:uncharacterized protein YeaO (DUF488 family)
LQLRTFRIGSPRQRGEGLRIGTVRFLPRGVPKADYAERDLFDVWLPSLAPSRRLLAAAKQSGMSFETFAKRYAVEMRKTEARQTIALVAALARRTPLVVGCYCGDENHCHRSVLLRLIREAAGF